MSAEENTQQQEEQQEVVAAVSPQEQEKQDTKVSELDQLKAELSALKGKEDGDAEEEEKEPKEEEKKEEDNLSYKESLDAQKELGNDLTKKGVDFNQLIKELETDGELSEEMYERLEKAEYPKVVIDQLIRGFKQDAENFVEQVQGFTSYPWEEVTKFVAEQGDTEIAKFNLLIEQGNVETLRWVIKGIEGELNAKQGIVTNKPVNTIMGKTQVLGNRANVKGFNSIREQTEAMNDPRYRKDNKYREEVMKKLENTNKF